MWKSLRFSTVGLFFGLVFALRVDAALHLVLTQGVNAAIPVALVPFSGQSDNVAGNTTLSNIIKSDLQNSGEFRIKTPEVDNQPNNLGSVNFSAFQKLGVNALIMGQIKKTISGGYQVSFQLLNVYGQNHEKLGEEDADKAVLLNQQFRVSQAGLRQLGHHISDLIYEKLTGIKGVFSTKIAYVLVKQLDESDRQYQLVVADADGFNPQVLLQSSQPIMSPAWTPDGDSIAYVSFEGHEASIYLQKLSTGTRKRISRSPGINGAPAFSPDGKKLALVLSKTGSPKIYILDLMTKKLEKITKGYSIDTEPAWAPDGKSLYFTSSRAGGPQIFQYDFDTRQVSRVTFDGSYNARACLTPHGKMMVMMHREMDLFGIAKLNLSSGRMTVLTTSGNDESPSLAPNGKMVLYGTQFAGREVLGVVSIGGRVKLRLPAQAGNVQDPAWSPFLS